MTADEMQSMSLFLALVIAGVVAMLLFAAEEGWLEMFKLVGVMVATVGTVCLIPYVIGHLG